MQQLQQEHQAQAKAKKAKSKLKLVESPPAIEPVPAPEPAPAEVVAMPTADVPTRTCGVSLPLPVHQELRARVERGEARSIKEAALQAIVRGLAVRG